MKSYLSFSIICLILCCLLGCGWFVLQAPPGTKIISPESDFQAIEGEARIVLEWMKAHGYYLNHDNKKSFYILVIPAPAGVPPLYISSNFNSDSPQSWTQGKSDKVTFTVYHDHFMIKVEGIGEAGFTFDEDRGLQVYDRSQKDN